MESDDTRKYLPQAVPRSTLSAQHAHTHKHRTSVTMSRTGVLRHRCQTSRRRTTPAVSDLAEFPDFQTSQSFRPGLETLGIPVRTQARRQ